MPAKGGKKAAKPASKTKPARSGPRSRATATPETFYERALNDAERIRLREAADVAGLDEEIAVLRVKLHSALEDRPEDLPLMMRGIELLVKAVSAKYRLSKEAEDDLADNLETLIRSVGGALAPELFADE